MSGWPPTRDHSASRAHSGADLEEPMPVVYARDLWLTFAGPPEATVLRGLDLTVNPGEFVAIVGPNGAGKTVCTHAITGRYQGRSDVRISGELRICGEDVIGLDGHGLRRLRATSLGPILQDFSGTLNPTRSVGGQLREMQRLDPGDAEDAETLLRQVNFPAESVKDRPHQLSQGMKQRALVVFGLANRPRLLIADEVTSALDVINQQVILELIARERQRRPELAVLMVSHDSRLVRGYADRVLRIEEGRVVAEGRPETITPIMPLPAIVADLAARRAGRPLLVGRGIRQTFRTPLQPPRQVLRGFDLDLRHREHTALIGASGSGKTTLANLLTGVLPIARGSVERLSFDGISLRGLHRPRHPLRHRIQMVFQDPDASIGSIDPRLPVEDVILEPRLAREPGAEAEGRAWIGRQLERFDLAHLARRRAADLSGGQRQRVEILRAFHGLDPTRPTLMVADEPTSMLDPEFVEQVVRIFAAFAREYDVTYLFITHSLELMWALCHRVLVMFDGEFVESAPVPALTSDPGHPYSQLLLRAGREGRPRGDDPELQRFELPRSDRGCPAYGWCATRSPRCDRERPTLMTSGDRRIACHHPRHAPPDLEERP